MNETPKKLKIGLVIDCFFPMVDGVVIVVDNYAKQLSEYADVTVFTAGNKISKTIEHPYKVVYCQIPGVRLPDPPAETRPRLLQDPSRRGSRRHSYSLPLHDR